MRRLVAILLLLPTGHAWGGSYFVDAGGVGTGSANGSSVDNQCAGPSDPDCLAASGGDTVYLCNSTSTLTLADSGISDTNRLTYNAQCAAGGVPLLVDGADTQDVCLTVQGSNVNVVGMPGDPWTSPAGTMTQVRRCRKRGIMVRTAVSNVTVRHFETYDIDGTTQSDQEGAGAIVDNVTTVGTTTGVSNVVFEYLYSHDNGAFGWATASNGTGIECRFCRLDRNGSLYHGGGAFIHPYRITVTAGWTDLSGGVFERNSLSSTDNVDTVYWIDQTTFLSSIGACGTPSPGQFCYTVGAPGTGKLRVNLNGAVSANGQSIQYRRGPLTGVVISDSSASYNLASDGTHGAGIQPDDLSGAVVVRRSFASFNEGPGFKAFRTQGTVFESVLAWENGKNSGNSLGDRSGIHADESAGTVVRHATSVSNESYGVQGGKGDTTIHNAIFANNALLGARGVIGAMTLNYSNLWGNASGATGTINGASIIQNNGFAVDPGFLGGESPQSVNGFCLDSTSALVGAGFHFGPWLLDVKRHDVGSPANVGALGPCSGRALSTGRVLSGTRASN